MGTPRSTPQSRLAALVLGDDPRLRLRLGRYFAATAVYALCTLLVGFGAWSGLTDPTLALLMGLVNVSGCLVFYGAIRSGWSLRRADPALTMAQMVFAIGAITMAYLSSAPVRGMLVVLMALVLVFGAFTLSSRECRALGWLAVASLGAAMGAGAAWAPATFDPRTEAVHFILCAAVLPLIANLAGQLSEMRSAQRAQKVELRSALERVQQLATHDELTGLPNRRQVMELLAHEERRAMRQVAPLCVCLLDIDHFKIVNDTLGHQSGDESLRQFARILGGGLRGGDVLARWGGEEFILLLPATPLDEAARVVERLRARCNDSALWAPHPELQLSFSAGLSAHVAGEPTQLAMARADAALYQAKRSGRNRLEVA